MHTQLLVRFIVVIEGCHDVLLPVQMLLSAYLNRFDPERESAFDPALAAFLVDPANWIPGI